MWYNTFCERKMTNGHIDTITQAGILCKRNMKKNSSLRSGEFHGPDLSGR